MNNFFFTHIHSIFIPEMGLTLSGSLKRKETRNSSNNLELNRHGFTFNLKTFQDRQFSLRIISQL